VPVGWLGGTHRFPYTILPLNLAGLQTSLTTLMTDTSEAQEHAELQRESLPGTLEYIRSLVVPQLAADWGKLKVAGRMTGPQASHECVYTLRGSEEHVPLAVADTDTLNAALVELHGRMKEEMGIGWRGISLEYDADKVYSVSISTS
jgi:hypothetical protein